MKAIWQGRVIAESGETREAGGYVTEIDGPGRPESGASILAANDALHRPLMRLLAGRERRRAAGSAP